MMKQIGMVLFDRGAKFTKHSASARKTAKACEESLRLFQAPIARDKLKLLYTDGAPEMIKAGQALKCNHDTSTPYRSAINGVAERRVRHVLEGT
eukprot:2163427-Heterocapsa_arctica.AAC.1